jgi:hypothetical protein
MPRLSHFIPDAIELARQGEAVHFGLPSQQLEALRSAFFFAHALSISFSGNATRLSTSLQVSLLEQLARSLDAAGDVAGAVCHCMIIIGDGQGVDAHGRLWLRHDGTVATWAHELQCLDVALVQERRAQQAEMRRVEVEVAAALGLRAVFAGDRLAISELYRDFLQVRWCCTYPSCCLCTQLLVCVLTTRMQQGARWGMQSTCSCSPLTQCPIPCVQGWVAQAASLRPAACSAGHTMSVLVVPTADAVDVVTLLPGGVVQARTDCDLSTLHALLQEQGPAVVAELEAAAKVEQELAEIARQVEQRLRLRRLFRDPVLSVDEFRSGCCRLLQHRDWLLKYVENCSLQLSVRNEIATGSRVIDVAWNFEL